VKAGEKVFIVGSSGSGKSTLLNLLAGILVPQQGSIHMLGTDFSRLGTRQKDRFRAAHIGIIFQQFNLIPYLDVETNIKLATHFGKSPANGTRNKILAVLDSLGLPSSLLLRRADSLSVGQQQRVAIARAVINKPEIIIADEPTSALDNDARDGFMELLMKVQQEQQSTVIFVSHDRTLARHFTRVLEMADINQCEVAADVA
jgi:putative ABC transport system ATP-binding protein